MNGINFRLNYSIGYIGKFKLYHKILNNLMLIYCDLSFTQQVYHGSIK